MKVKTSELRGAPLNWAVAQIRQLPLDDLRTSRSVVFYLGEPWMPDIYWEQGGPIIEEQDMCINRQPVMGHPWVATIYSNAQASGPSPLIAAMRCYVAACLGDEVDVPEVLFSDK
jgi:hypothetical protein